MIWESVFWKDDLLRRARELRRRKKQRRWPEASLACLEQLTMVGFYSVRKLIEAHKLSCTTVRREIPIHRYPPTGKPVTLLNWHKLEALYDLDRREPSSLALPLLCHQFVHSYVFTSIFGRVDNLKGFLLASDRQRTRALLEVDVDEVIRTFELVGRDYPADGRWILNPKTGDYDVTDSSLASVRQSNRLQRTSAAAAMARS